MLALAQVAEGESYNKIEVIDRRLNKQLSAWGQHQPGEFGNAETVMLKAEQEVFSNNLEYGSAVAERLPEMGLTTNRQPHLWPLTPGRFS